MGVYIEGMVMPGSCYKCPLRRRDGMDIVCLVAHERFSVADVNILDYRLDNCPLIHVPPHGDLVDKSEMFIEFVIEGQKSKRYKVGENWELNGEEIRRVISKLPTVIEAEEDNAL